MNIIFLGAPGAGKGTHAARVAEGLGACYIATGDLFRQTLGQDTELARTAKSYMEKGQLVPDEVTIKMVLDRISLPDCAKGVVLDGFPRNLNQAESLDRALAQQGKQIDRVLYIKVSEQELVRRLGGRWICRNCQAPYHEVFSPPKIARQCDRCGGELYQRADDKPETVKKRLKVYTAETAPLIEHYTRARTLVEVDGEGEVAEVARRIDRAVGASQARR